MTQEEKAKAYDIALDKIKRLLGSGSNCSREDLEHVFPELRESEDERIRKDIVTYLKSILSNKKYGDKFIEDWIAWLEKQGEQKPTKEYNITGISSKHAQGKLGEMIKRKLEMEKQGEQKLANSANNCKDEPNTVVVIPKFRVGDVIRPKGSMAEYTIKSISGECYHGKGWELHISCDDDYELVNQNNAWSEEDIKKIDTIIGYIASSAGEKLGVLLPCIDWLKSLKERVQPNPVWSEEDRRMLIGLIDELDAIMNKATPNEISVYSKYANWLNSIKDRVGCKVNCTTTKEWKPSDEQMKQLGWIAGKNKDNIIGKELMSLYQDLKKLKE